MPRFVNVRVPLVRLGRQLLPACFTLQPVRQCQLPTKQFQFYLRRLSHLPPPAWYCLSFFAGRQLCREICSSYAFYGTQFGQEVSDAALLKDLDTVCSHEVVRSSPSQNRKHEEQMRVCAVFRLSRLQYRRLVVSCTPPPQSTGPRVSNIAPHNLTVRPIWTPSAVLVRR